MLSVPMYINTMPQLIFFCWNKILNRSPSDRVLKTLCWQQLLYNCVSVAVSPSFIFLYALQSHQLLCILYTFIVGWSVFVWSTIEWKSWRSKKKNYIKSLLEDSIPCHHVTQKKVINFCGCRWWLHLYWSRNISACCPLLHEWW